MLKLSTRWYWHYLNRTRLECKEKLAHSKPPKAFHLNRTRLECKVFIRLHIHTLLSIWIEPDWNVKHNMYGFVHVLDSIWIEPDWNVKIISLIETANVPFIWIEPDWNVKVDKVALMADLYNYLNRTRLECKVLWR